MPGTPFPTRDVERANVAVGPPLGWISNGGDAGSGPPSRTVPKQLQDGRVRNDKTAPSQQRWGTGRL